MVGKVQNPQTKVQKPKIIDAALEITKTPGEYTYQFSLADPNAKKWIAGYTLTIKDTKPEKIFLGNTEVKLLPKPSSGKSFVREGETKIGKTTSLLITLETAETELTFKSSRLENSEVVFTSIYRLKKMAQTEYEAQKKKILP